MTSESLAGNGREPTAAELKLQFKLDAAMNDRARAHDISETAINRASRSWQKSKGKLHRVMTVIHREKKITFKLAADAKEPYYKHAVHKKKGRATNKPRRRVTRARTTPTSTGGGQPVAPAATGLSPESMGKVTGMAVTILATLDDQEIAALIQTLDWLTKQGAIT